MTFLSENFPRCLVLLSQARKFVVLVLIGGGLCACATQTPIQSNQATSYEGVVKTADGTMEIVPKQADLGRYKWAVVPVIELEPSVVSEELKETAKSVVADLQNGLDTELGRHFSMNQPPDNEQVLVVHVRITRITEASPGLNVLTTALLGTPLRNGALAVELEAKEASTGRQVALLVWADSGGVMKDFKGNYSRDAHARMLAGRFAIEAGKFLSPLGQQ